MKYLVRSVLLLTLAGCASQPEAPPPPQPDPVVNLPTAILATSWQAETILEQPATATESTLQIGSDGSVSGNAGCNRYTGNADIDGSDISFGLLATTRMMCEPAANGQEQAFLEAVAATRSWRRVGSTLDLLDEDGTRLMRLGSLEGPL